MAIRADSTVGHILSLPLVGENMAPHPDPLPIRWGEGEDPLAAGSHAASHPSPLSIRWRGGTPRRLVVLTRCALAGAWRFAAPMNCERARFRSRRSNLRRCAGGVSFI